MRLKCHVLIFQFKIHKTITIWRSLLKEKFICSYLYRFEKVISFLGRKRNPHNGRYLKLKFMNMQCQHYLCTKSCICNMTVCVSVCRPMLFRKAPCIFSFREITVNQLLSVKKRTMQLNSTGHVWCLSKTRLLYKMFQKYCTITSSWLLSS